VVLDLHSGRIAGRWGVWVVDAAAALMLVLAVSGFVLWVNLRRKERYHLRQSHGAAGHESEPHQGGGRR